MDGEFQEKIEELLVCTICFDCFLEPRSLSCGHIFCHQCLVQFATKSDWSIKCPTCRQEQVGIYSIECLSRLDAPLYIKQALDVIQRYRGDGKRNRSFSAESSVEDLLENCFLGDDDGCWGKACVATEATMRSSTSSDIYRDEPLYNDKTKQLVCLDYDDRCSKKGFQNDNNKGYPYAVSLPPESDKMIGKHRNPNDEVDGDAHANHDEDSEAFMLTQEYTFDKLWGKLVKGVKKKKKALKDNNNNNNRTTRNIFQEGSENVDLSSGDNTQSQFDQEQKVNLDVDLKYHQYPYNHPNARSGGLGIDNSSKYLASRSTLATATPSVRTTASNSKKNTRRLNDFSSKPEKQSSRQIPKHLVPSSSVLGGSSSSGVHMSKYIPGTMSKSRSVYGMAGYGLSLNNPGQFGIRRPRNNRTSSTPSSSDVAPPASQDFQGAFGKTPCFMPPYVKARPKVMFAMKF